MKKRIGLLIGILLLTGCGNKEPEYKKTLESYAKSYYEKYMANVKNQTQAEITIEMMKKANEYGGNFDLSKLKECSDKTTVFVNVDENGQITSYEYDLKCD